MMMADNQEAIKLYIDLVKKALTASIYEESGWENTLCSNNHFKKLLLTALSKNSLLLVKCKQFDKTKRQEGRDWPLFGYTMAGHLRLDNLELCIEDVLTNEVPGDFIEAGVWRGGTTIFMRALLKVYGVTSRKVWVADSFDGLPIPKDKDDGQDLSRVDYLKVSLEQVKANFQNVGLLDEQVEFLKGWFCDTLPNAKIDNLAILRLVGICTARQWIR